MSVVHTYEPEQRRTRKLQWKREDQAAGRQSYRKRRPGSSVKAELAFVILAVVAIVAFIVAR